jgi:hypothetical protein
MWNCDKAYASSVGTNPSLGRFFNIAHSGNDSHFIKHFQISVPEALCEHGMRPHGSVWSAIKAMIESNHNVHELPHFIFVSLDRLKLVTTWSGLLDGGK